MYEVLKYNFHNIIDDYKIPSSNNHFIESAKHIAIASSSNAVAGITCVTIGAAAVLLTGGAAAGVIGTAVASKVAGTAVGAAAATAAIKASKEDIPEFENTNPDIYPDICKYCYQQNMDETYLYTNALISKATFSKIRSMKRSGYKPDKSTIIRLSLVLHLSLAETQRMLGKLGYVLSDSLVIDKVVAWCIEHNCYDFAKMDDILVANNIPNTLMPAGLA